MKIRTLLAGLCMLATSAAVQAARVDTLMVASQAMHKEIKVVYIIPDRLLAPDSQPCPTVYLLHGYGGNAGTWVDMKPELARMADEKGMLFVCPDGKNSWYWDSPQDSTYRYETFVGTELVNYTDKRFATLRTPKARAISGLSMGGHGALWLAIRHKDTFGAAGSMSGGVNICAFPGNWEMKKRLGDYETNREVWEAHTVINQVDQLQNGDLALIIDCGEADFFLKVNQALHQALLDRKIDHDFITRPGGHNRAYWSNSIDYHLLFFEKFFQKGKEGK